MTIDGFKTHKILITHVYFDRIKNELYYFNYRMHDMHVYTIDMDIAIVKLIRYVKGDFALDIQYDLILDLAAIDIDTADLLELISLDNVSISYNIIDLTMIKLKVAERDPNIFCKNIRYVFVSNTYIIICLEDNTYVINVDTIQYKTFLQIPYCINQQVILCTDIDIDIDKNKIYTYRILNIMTGVDTMVRYKNLPFYIVEDIYKIQIGGIKIE